MGGKRAGFCLAGLGFGMGKMFDRCVVYEPVSRQDLALICSIKQRYIILPKSWTFGCRIPGKMIRKCIKRL
jgi:hypothetical protein